MQYISKSKMESILKNINEPWHILFCPKSLKFYPFNTHQSGPATFQVLSIHTGLQCWIVQYSSVSQSCLSLCNPMDCSTPGFPVHHQLPESAQTHVHCIGDAIQPSHPLYHPLLLLPSIFPSIRVLSNESFLRIRWPKYWSFSFSISPSNEYSGLISIRMEWLDLLPVQWALKSLLQHHSSKASIL